MHSTHKNTQQAQYSYQMASRRPEKRQKADYSALLVALISLIIIIPISLVSLTIIIFQSNHLNLPGVYVLDKEVGLLNPQETAAWVDNYWNRTRQIKLSSSTNEDISYWLNPGELGYWVDPEGTAQAAYSIGRRADPFADVIAAASGQSQIVLPVLYFDEESAYQNLEKISAGLIIHPENATVAYQDNTWIALPGIEGREVAIEATIEDHMENAFINLLTQTATLHMRSVPPAVDDLTHVLADIDSVVAQDLLLEAYDPISDESFKWSVPLETKRGWVQVNEETYDIHMAYTRHNLELLLNQWETDLGDGRSFKPEFNFDGLIESWENAQTFQTILYHDPITYTVQAGDSLWGISLRFGMPMWYILEANPGLTIHNLEAGMALTIPSKNILLPLPVVPNKRIVIDISTQRMTTYENGQVRSTHIISTGVEDSPTFAGVFQVRTHKLNAYASNWDLYMPHFIGIYEAWPGFMNGLHGLPLLSSGQRLWAGNLGTPVSYGCIIMALDEAEDIYHWADPGVVVEITK